MRAGGLPDGAYTLGGQVVRVENGKATLPDGTLAGSAVSLSECLRRVIRFGVPAEQAIRSATLIPAQSVGLGDVTGTVEAGRCADLIAVREDPLADLRALRHVDMVVTRGRRIDHPKVKVDQRVAAELDKFL